MAFYDVEDVKWIRPWPPETPEERYLYDVVALMPALWIERVQWLEDRYSVMIAANRKAVTLHVERGSLSSGNQPDLTLSGPFADDAHSSVDRNIHTSPDPHEAAEQIRHFFGNMPSLAGEPNEKRS